MANSTSMPSIKKLDIGSIDRKMYSQFVNELTSPIMMPSTMPFTRIAGSMERNFMILYDHFSFSSCPRQSPVPRSSMIKTPDSPYNLIRFCVINHLSEHPLKHAIRILYIHYYFLQF